ncbi:hypothetical protein CJA_2244 [Cellvibrio japonicus Ueda107]|uniref:Uncharacterized protein n=1 Tax=Cellvibrio japonicus (strain Ueda107) TaxID=498211 RepID=B3PJD1_CELJU|nr:hypothetical protein CJA_2244 [Cellvibrio japonicus Ueda107]
MTTGDAGWSAQRYPAQHYPGDRHVPVSIQQITY